jgi:hypothetical protein
MEELGKAHLLAEAGPEVGLEGRQGYPPLLGRIDPVAEDGAVQEGDGWVGQGLHRLGEGHLVNPPTQEKPLQGREGLGIGR